MNLKSVLKYYFIEKNRINKIWIKNNKFLIELVSSLSIVEIEPEMIEGINIFASVTNKGFDVYLKAKGVKYFGRNIEVDNYTAENFYSIIEKPLWIKMRTKHLRFCLTYLLILISALTLPLLKIDFTSNFLSNLRVLIIFNIAYILFFAVYDYFRLTKIINK